MTFLSRILARVGRERIEEADRNAEDGASGAPADQHSTTGTTEDDRFVGRVAGEDPGYLDTGAERRERDDDPGR